VVVVLLCCAGIVVSGVLAYQRATEGLAKAPVLPDLPGATDPGNGPGQGGTAPVVYEVTGDGPATIEYTDESGSIQRESTVALPWRKETTVRRTGLIMLRARRDGTASGDVSCRLTINGQEKQAKQSTGQFAMVACVQVGVN
jgi:hypothetical protein